MTIQGASPFDDPVAQDLPDPGTFTERSARDGSTCKIDSDGICHTHDCACWFCGDVIGED